MSLRINNNVTAMTALRNLTTSNESMSQSINRLSTGLRINTAADDPTGLVISENMRSQLKGISQATTNAQDAVNMAKTADGALNEVQTLLRNIRSVAVHAANTATVDAAQLQADQSEIDSTVASINRIASSTTWGSKRLLDGTSGTTANVTDPSEIAGAYFGSNFGGQTIANGPLTVTLTHAATQTTLATDNTFAATTSTLTAGNIVVNGYTFTSNGTTDTVQGMVDKINQQSSNTGVTASIVPNGSNYSITLSSVEYGSQFPVNYFDASGVLNSAPNPSPTTAGSDATASVTTNVTTANGTKTTQTVTFTGGQGQKASGLRLTDVDGNVITLTSAGNASTSLTSATGVGAITSGNLRFQIGPDSNQSVTYGLPDVRAMNLGTGVISGANLSTINLSTSTGASQAIDVIDNAISQLSALRGKLGSFQSNFLESTVRSLSVANENLTASESSIRDADMASEMTQYTKYQVIEQSGVSVLAQANQLPQQILKLLGG